MKKVLERILLGMPDWLSYILSKIFVLIIWIYWRMSKKHKKRKHKKQKNQNNTNKNSDNLTAKNTTRREPVAVMENVKHRSTPEPIKQSIKNTFPGRYYQVVSQPEKWDGKCTYVGQIGKCLSTDKVYGAKLKFSEGEMLYLPFDNIQPSEDKIAKTVMAESFVDSTNFPNQNVIKGLYYKVVKKPPGWKTACRFLERTGKCVRIDDRGARLSFPDGDEVAFPVECIKEVPSVDLSNSKNSNKEDINENNVNIGELFRVIKKPSKLSDAIGNALVGKIGKARWANYRVVCLKFSNGEGYNVEFDALERYKPIELANPTIVTDKLNANNIVIGREYKLKKMPPDWSGSTLGFLDKTGKIEWVSGHTGNVMMIFTEGPNQIKKLVPIDCLGDLPRPTEAELIDIIKKNPEKILKIIKGLRKITKLKPVIEFIDGACLPEVKSTVSNIPSCLSESSTPQTVGDASEEMQNKVLAMIGPIDVSSTGNPS